MPKGQVDPFGENIAADDAAAEAEELGTATEVVAEAPVEAKPEVKTEQGEAEPAPGEPVDRTKYDNVYQALKHEREARKEYEKKATELTERWARLEEKQKILDGASKQAEQFAQQQAIAAQRPDETIDPVGAKQWDHDQKIAMLEQQLTQATAQLQNFGQNYQQAQEQQYFSNWVQATAQQYAQQDPEYQAKANFAAQKRMEFWAGLGADPASAQDLVAKESVMIARLAQQRGVNFAPLIANLATQWGYQSQNGQPTQNGGANPAAQARLQQVAAGQRVQGISRIPAAGPSGPSNIRNMTMADVSAMSEAQYNRIIATPEGRREMTALFAGFDGVEPEEMMTAMKVH